jgi:hypothetical protein
MLKIVLLFKLSFSSVKKRLSFSQQNSTLRKIKSNSSHRSVGPFRENPTSVSRPYLRVINNDLDGTSWADRVAFAAHIAFVVVDNKPLIMLINCLERAPLPAFPAGNAFFCNADTPERDVLAAKAKTGTQ